MAKQQLTNEVIKQTVKQYEYIKKNVKKIFDEAGTFYGELENVFNDTEAVHSWFDDFAKETKIDSCGWSWEDFEGDLACIQDDNTILDITVEGNKVWTKVTNYMVEEDTYVNVAVPFRLVIDPKILTDTIKKYRKSLNVIQRIYEADPEKVIKKIAEKYIEKYGKRLNKIDDHWNKFAALAKEIDPQWSNYRIRISDVYIRECADGLDHLFVIYEDRFCNSKVYVSGFTN